MSRYGLSAIIFLILIMCVCATSTDTNYTSTGQNNFMLSETNLNHFTGVAYDSYTKSISSVNMPYVADLNNDSLNEIIVMDFSTVRLYRNKTLSILDSYSLPATSYDDMIIYDIDGDGILEIITSASSTNAQIHILNYNGTSFFEKATFNGTQGYSPTKTMIQCKSKNNCILVAGLPKTSSNTYDKTYIYGFNSTSVTSVISTLYSWSLGSTDNSDLCFPAVKSIDVKDYDNDGNNEYIFSTFLTRGSTGGVHIFYVDNNGTGVNTEKMISITSGVYLPSSYSNCLSYNIGSLFTNPLVDNWDGSTSNGLETAIGYMTSSSTFKISTFYSGGTTLDSHPSVYTADGQIVSNIAKACIFSDTNCNDFCVLGHSTTSNTLDLLCGTQTTGEWYDSREFSMIPPYNLTANYMIYRNMIHSIQAISDTLPVTPGSVTASPVMNPSEFSSSYGIIEINEYQSLIDQITGTPGKLIVGFQNPRQNASVLMSDVEKSGRDDMLAMTLTNIWYIDDRYSNSQAGFGTITINPTTASTWKINTSVGVTVEVTDTDSDSVRAKAILYFGDANQQDSGWSVYSASGTTFSFMFTANETINNGKLIFYVNDNKHNDSNATYTKSFSVGLEGLSYGEGTETIGVNITTPSLNQTCFGNVCVANNNTILTGTQQLDIGLGLNIGKTAMWLLFMLILGIGVFIACLSENVSSGIAFTVVGFIEIIMLLLGFFLTMIGWGVLITVIIVCLAIISMQIRHFFTGGKSGGSGAS